MNNEIFSFQRFWNYFNYDLKQLWRHNGLAVVLLGFISLIVYLAWVLCSLIFTVDWSAPGFEARVVIFFIGWLILIFRQVHTYGYLTEKRAGSSWLMVPASALEKSISMIIITSILMPLAYIVSYLLVDAVIATLDPTAGEAILLSGGNLASAGSKIVSEASANGIDINVKLFALPLIFQAGANILYFLLCGICFKKWKLASAFGILVGLGMLSSFLFSSLALGPWSKSLSMMNDDPDPLFIQQFVNTSLNLGTAMNIILFVGLAFGIYYRIKTLKH